MRKEIAPDAGVEVRLRVKNVGDRPGAETVQLYIEDVVSSVATPVEATPRLCQAGPRAGRGEDLYVPPWRRTIWRCYDADLRRVVEPGQFRVMVGSSSADIRLSGEFQVK